MVQMSTKEDEDGNVELDPVCICGDHEELEGMYTLECCQRKVHIECLALNLQMVPFCMFCSRSLSSMYDSLPERTFSQQPFLSQTSELEKSADVKEPLSKEILFDETATTVSTTTATMLTMTTATTVPTAQQESIAAHHTPANVIPNDDDENIGALEVEDETIEDANRRSANSKKRKMQEYSAEKEMKRRGEELLAEGLGVGAVVTCKVDYRTFVHAEGLVAIVYKCSNCGGAIVCTENGVLTHDVWIKIIMYHQISL
jgi:hypothetical protein